jgi:hypothetical protein
VELAELFTEPFAEVLAEAVEVAGGTELKARVEIRQLKELDSLRLSIVVAAVLIEITAEILMEVKASLVVYCLDSSVS